MLVLTLLLLAAGFWETKPPEDWTTEEVTEILADSPWSRTLRGKNRAEQVRVHLATAWPMQQAEKRERAFERRTGAADASFEEYLALLAEGNYIVLAVKAEDRDAFADAELVRRLQKESFLRIGRKPHALVTHFPPSSSDPYLRLVFPRVAVSGKTLDFQFVVPGAFSPHRVVSFPLKDLVYRGKLEF